MLREFSTILSPFTVPIQTHTQRIGSFAVELGNTVDVLVVVYTIRGEDIRLVSARRATRQEIREYES